jgi:chorismate mutase
MTIRCRGVRGATTCESNTREAILEATREMLELLIESNGITPDEIASAIFTTTPDLDAEYPAVAARALGWTDTALLCGHEMSVPGGLPCCIRVLVHWNTARRADEVLHVYLRGARNLRPDRSAALAAFQSLP